MHLGFFFVFVYPLLLDQQHILASPAAFWGQSLENLEICLGFTLDLKLLHTPDVDASNVLHFGESLSFLVTTIQRHYSLFLMSD